MSQYMSHINLLAFQLHVTVNILKGKYIFFLYFFCQNLVEFPCQPSLPFLFSFLSILVISRIVSLVYLSGVKIVILFIKVSMQDVLSKNKTKRYFYTYLTIQNQAQVGEVSLNQFLLKSLISFGAVVLNGATLDNKSKSKLLDKLYV